MKAVSKIATIARDTCIAWPTSAGLKRTREDSGIAIGPSGTKSSVDAGAASGLSKNSRRERREDKKGGTAPNSKERKGVQQKLSTQGTKVDVDLLCFFCAREGHILKDCPDANDEQKKDLLKLKWKEWKAEKPDTDSKRMSSLKPMDSVEDRKCLIGVGISRLTSSAGDWRFTVQFAPNPLGPCWQTRAVTPPHSRCTSSTY
jgi:hypothetical protein